MGQIGRRATGGLLVVSVVLMTDVARSEDVSVQATRSDKSAPRMYRYSVVATYPHDAEAFTQGLAFWKGWLYESTGQYGRSKLRRIRLESGEVVREVLLAPKYFGMGLTVWTDQLIQATGREKMALVYGTDDLQLRSELGIGVQAWGIASTGQSLAASDGSAVVRFLNPRTFVEERQVTVRDGPQLVTGLNELEFINGELYANLLRKDRIVRIDPLTGVVTGWVGLEGLAPPGFGGESDFIMNGIAYDRDGGRLFVTGRLWPKLFEIRIVPQ